MRPASVPTPGRPALQRALLDWAAVAGRDLPWRRTRDPWAVLVSELMLQQTQVARVIPRYEAFLHRFPTPAACAAAPAADVIRLWAGLGYNRRALHLHAAASAAGGRLPDTLDALLRLPGVGAYTARAVLAFAHERDVAVLDANALRALSRALGRPVDQATADALVPPGRGWAWNQAVLDLAPRCAARGRTARPARWRGRSPARGAEPAGRSRTPGRAVRGSRGSRAPSGRAGAGWSPPCGTGRWTGLRSPSRRAGRATRRGPGGWPRPSSRRASSWPTAGCSACPVEAISGGLSGLPS
jgi:A/G-specific adenine glycosylase